MLKKCQDGRTLFYPLGVFGRRAFVVASTEKESLLRDSLRKYCWGMGGVGVIAGWVLIPFKEQLGFWQSACVLPGLTVVQYIVNRLCFDPFTQGMTLAHVPHSPIDYWWEMGQTRSLLRLILGATVGAGATVFFGLAYGWTREPIYIFVGLSSALSLLVSLFSLASRWMSHPE